MPNCGHAGHSLPPGTPETEAGSAESWCGLTVPAHAFWIVCLTVFIDSLGGSISAPVLPFYAKAFDSTTAEIGFLFSIFSAAQVVFLPVMGKLSDLFGRRAVLVGSLFGAALGAFAQGLAPTYSVLLAARVLSGACGAVGSTANVYVSDITHQAARGQYLGYLMNSNGAAFAFGPGLGGGLSRFGLNVPIEVNGCMCLVAGLLAWAYLPESPVFVRQQQEAMRAEEKACQQARGEKVCLPMEVWSVCAVEFLRGISFSAIFALYGIFALNVYGMDSLHIGYAVCVGALTLICSNVWLNGPLERWLGHFGSAAFGASIMAIGEIVLAYAPELHLSLLGMWSVYMGQAIAGSNIAAITSFLANDDNRGEVMAMQQMAQALGRVIGPIWLGHLSDIDERCPFALAALCVLVAAGILMSLRVPYMRKQMSVDLDVRRPLIPTPALSEAYTKEDIYELGTFLCELLDQGGYRWHEEEQRKALKKALALHFPPLNKPEASNWELDLQEDAGEAGTGVDGTGAAVARKNSVTMTATPSRHNPMGPVKQIGAEMTFTGDDSNFLRSPMIGRRPFQRTARPCREGRDGIPGKRKTAYW